MGNECKVRAQQLAALVPAFREEVIQATMISAALARQLPGADTSLEEKG